MDYTISIFNDGKKKRKDLPFPSSPSAIQSEVAEDRTADG